jgi:hypothetical protein
MTYCIQIAANLVAGAAVCTRLLERERKTPRKTLHRTPPILRYLRAALWAGGNL